MFKKKYHGSGLILRGEKPQLLLTSGIKNMDYYIGCQKSDWTGYAAFRQFSSAFRSNEPDTYHFLGWIK